MERRAFLRLAATGVVAGGAVSQPSVAATATAALPSFKAIAFDGFPVFDPRAVGQAAERVFPGHGAELIAAWRARQFDYQWLRALAGRYVDFWQATQDSLLAAARSLQLALSSSQRDELMAPYMSLDVWPDVPAALSKLHGAGLRMRFLSNLTVAMIESAVRKSSLGHVFEPPLSTDRIKSYKPDPRAYKMAIDAFELKREEILFVASSGWDAAGAKWFGYPTYWVNRMGASADELGTTPDGTGPDLNALVRFVLPGSAG